MQDIYSWHTLFVQLIFVHQTNEREMSSFHAHRFSLFCNVFIRVWLARLMCLLYVMLCTD